METAFLPEATGGAGLSVRLFGAPLVLRDGTPLDLPASRKVLMLLAYLVLSPRPVSRSHLCDLLWDGPNDPRGELRWCLTKLRRLLDADDREVVQTRSDHVAIVLQSGEADVLAVQHAARAGLDGLDADEHERLAALLGAGGLLDGLAADRTPVFETWLSSQRRHFHGLHLAVLGRLCDLHPTGSERRLQALERRAALAPTDQSGHVSLLAELAVRGDLAGAESHLAATVRLLNAEGIDPAPLRSAWHGLRARPRAVTERAAMPLLPAAVALAGTEKPPAGAVAPVTAEGDARRRPRVAVMPPGPSAGSPPSGLADALAHDVINRLARLRSLAVIAWGSVQALARRGLSPQEAATALQADYLASGHLRRVGESERLHIDLVDVGSDRLLWSDAFDVERDDGLLLLDRIGGAIVASLTHAIELAERDRALVKAPGSLNAWETYHRGLWHMYQFTEAENRAAQRDFLAATRLDPTFARAHAGLSFTHWQNAFQRWGDRQAETDAAHAAAAQSLRVDDLDPAAHWAMGRALWLRGSHDESLAEMHRAVDISPSFSLGHYAIAFVQSQSGDPTEAIRAAELSRQLSPFDPLLFGIYGALAMAHARLERFAEASEWALLAAAQPNAHRVIVAIAAHCLALAGRLDEARRLAARLRAAGPDFTTVAFLDTFHFSPEGRRLFLSAGRSIGLA